MKNINTTLPGIALQKIGKLFQIEKEIENKSPQEKMEIRQTRAKPLVEDFFSWYCDNQDKVFANGIKNILGYAHNGVRGFEDIKIKQAYLQISLDL